MKLRRFPFLRMGALTGALLIGCTCAARQRPTTSKNVEPREASDTIRLGIVVGDAAKEAAREWDSTNAYQVERGKCVAAYDVSHTVIHGITLEIFAVTKFRPPKRIVYATPVSIRFACAGPFFHTHPPSLCEPPTGRSPKWHCIPYRGREKDCKPSDHSDTSDVQTLARRGDEFGVIQCGRGSFGFFFPARQKPAIPEPAPINIPDQHLKKADPE